MNAPVSVSKPRFRVHSGDAKGTTARIVQPPRVTNYLDAGKNDRRLRSLPSSTQAINMLMRTYGRTVTARARYLSRNNPNIRAAKRGFVGALVGNGIKPSWLIDDPTQKASMTRAWKRFAKECDAHGVTNVYGLQTIIARDMFDAGEVFARFRPRLASDGLTVPLQIQLLSSERLNWAYNIDLPNGFYIRSGIEFAPWGKRMAYHFYREQPGDIGFTGEYVRIPAEEVMHVFDPQETEMIRGTPQVVASMVRAAVKDAYDDAELEGKRIAALLAGFVEIDDPTADDQPFKAEYDAATDDTIDDALAFEPGTISYLRPNEKITFSSPKEVGSSYEAFQYRTDLQVFAGLGVPYEYGGDLRQTSYASQRAGMVKFRREIEQLQNNTIIHQFCDPIAQRFAYEAVMAGAVPAISPAKFMADPLAFTDVNHMRPAWEWVDPEKDAKADVLAVENKLKSRSDIIEEHGEDPEEIDNRIKADKERQISLGIDDWPQIRPAAAPASRPGG